MCAATKARTRLAATSSFFPQCNKPRPRMPLYAVINQVVTAKKIKTLLADEINNRISYLAHDSYRYQPKNCIESNYCKRTKG